MVAVAVRLLVKTGVALEIPNVERLALEHEHGLIDAELQAFDVTAPVIATPREIVRKFFQR